MGICVKIEMTDDGAVTVMGCEPNAGMATGGEGPAEAAGQSYQSVDEALRAAADLLLASDRDGMSPEEAMGAGYSRVKGAAMKPQVMGGAQYGDE